MKLRVSEAKEAVKKVVSAIKKAKVDGKVKALVLNFGSQVSKAAKTVKLEKVKTTSKKVTVGVKKVVKKVKASVRNGVKRAGSAIKNLINVIKVSKTVPKIAKAQAKKVSLSMKKARATLKNGFKIGSKIAAKKPKTNLKIK